MYRCMKTIKINEIHVSVCIYIYIPFVPWIRHGYLYRGYDSSNRTPWETLVTRTEALVSLVTFSDDSPAIGVILFIVLKVTGIWECLGKQTNVENQIFLQMFACFFLPMSCWHTQRIQNYLQSRIDGLNPLPKN